jgi:hypothetical protein
MDGFHGDETREMIGSAVVFAGAVPPGVAALVGVANEDVVIEPL